MPIELLQLLLVPDYHVLFSKCYYENNNHADAVYDDDNYYALNSFTSTISYPQYRRHGRCRWTNGVGLGPERPAPATTIFCHGMEDLLLHTGPNVPASTDLPRLQLCLQEANGHVVADFVRLVPAHEHIRAGGGPPRHTPPCCQLSFCCRPCGGARVSAALRSIIGVSCGRSCRKFSGKPMQGTPAPPFPDGCSRQTVPSMRHAKKSHLAHAVLGTVGDFFRSPPGEHHHPLCPPTIPLLPPERAKQRTTHTQTTHTSKP